MTIQDAIQTAIENLEGVRLPIRDAENANRIRTALVLLDALHDFVAKQTDTDQTEKGADAE